jgi:hypothetical protein
MGNIFGRLKGSDTSLGSVLSGSHCDAIPMAGVRTCPFADHVHSHECNHRRAVRSGASDREYTSWQLACWCNSVFRTLTLSRVTADGAAQGCMMAHLVCLAQSWPSKPSSMQCAAIPQACTLPCVPAQSYGCLRHSTKVNLCERVWHMLNGS